MLLTRHRYHSPSSTRAFAALSHSCRSNGIRHLVTIGVYAWMVMLAGCGMSTCAGDPPRAEVVDAATSDDIDYIEVPRPTIAPTPAPVLRPAPAQLTVSTDSDLSTYSDFAAVRELEIGNGSLAPVSKPTKGSDARADCALPEPAELARRLMNVERLQLTGCDAQAEALLAAFADRVVDLQLGDITITRSLADIVATMPRLRGLTLVRAAAPEINVRAWARALSLERLALRELSHDTPLLELVSDSRSLTKLELEGRWVGYTAMQSVTKATRVRSLTMIDTAVGNYGLNLVKPLVDLRELYWDGSTFNDHSPLYLRDLPLEKIVCACPRLGDAGLRHLRLLANLRALELRQPAISESGWQHLARLTALEELRLTHCAVAPATFTALVELEKLRSLALEQASLTSPAIPDLGRLLGLETLVVGIDTFADAQTEHLAGLTKLRQLDLGGTQVSDAGLRALADLVALRELRLHHTRVTNEGLAHLAKLVALQTLELDHNDVVDDGVRHLAGLTELRDLRLDHTLVTDSGVLALAGLRQLERLNLAHTVVTDASAPTLAKLPNLRAINLEGTRLATGPNPTLPASDQSRSSDGASSQK